MARIAQLSERGRDEVAGVPHEGAKVYVDLLMELRDEVNRTEKYVEVRILVHNHYCIIRGTLCIRDDGRVHLGTSLHAPHLPGDLRRRDVGRVAGNVQGEAGEPSVRLDGLQSRCEPPGPSEKQRRLRLRTSHPP